MALVGAVLWVLGVTLGRLAYWTLYHGQRDIRGWDATDTIAATAVAVSLALFFYTRRPDRDPTLVTNLGLGYVILTALDLGLLVRWFPPLRAPHDQPRFRKKLQIETLPAAELLRSARCQSSHRSAR